MKLIKHSWIKLSFGTYKCTKCDCIKQHVPEYIAVNLTRRGPMLWYFRNGKQLAELPQCTI